MSDKAPFRNKVIIITGGGRGIGAAMGRRFAEVGAKTALLDVDQAGLQALGRELTESGAEVLTLRCDVRDPQSCRQAIDEILEAWGSIDILINNAGITHRSLFVDTAPNVVRRVMDTNFFGSVNCTRAALDALIKSRGSIVVVSSVAGYVPLMGRSAYAASKYALHGFFDTLRSEISAWNVRVLMVCPSFIKTHLPLRAMDGDGHEVDTKRRAVGKELSPDEVAAAVLKALERRRRLLLLSPLAKAAWWCARFAPRIWENLMKRSQRAEFGRSSDCLDALNHELPQHPLKQGHIRRSKSGPLNPALDVPLRRSDNRNVA